MIHLIHTWRCLLLYPFNLWLQKCTNAMLELLYYKWPEHSAFMSSEQRIFCLKWRNIDLLAHTWQNVLLIICPQLIGQVRDELLKCLVFFLYDWFNMQACFVNFISVRSCYCCVVSMMWDVVHEDLYLFFVLFFFLKIFLSLLLILLTFYSQFKAWYHDWL